MPDLGDLAAQQINYTDLLTLFIIKSFESDLSLSIKDIASKMSESESFVAKSIDRLVKARLIPKLEKMENNNFEDEKPRFLAPIELLEQNLTNNSKAMLLLLRMFCYEDLILFTSITDISKYTGISLEVMFKQIDELIMSDYINILTDDDFDECLLELSSILKWDKSPNMMTFSEYCDNVLGGVI